VSFERRRVFAGALVVLLGAAPLLAAQPWLHGATESYFGDGLSHVMLGRAIARDGLPHGWVDINLGGFPFGHHYPPLGSLLLALTMRLGVSPAVAIQVWGFLFTLSVPLVFHVAVARAGVRPSYAALGALFLAWVSPYNPFVGGYEVFFHSGLFSQIVALPICIALGGAIAAGTGRWAAPLGALAMSAHPQLGIATVAVAACAVVASSQRVVLVRFAKGAAGAGVFGAALYGQGVAAMDVPFGWPPNLGWRQVGFDTSRLGWWFVDGDLLDAGRSVAVLTALAAAAAVALALCVARPAARAALAAAAAAVVISVTGPALSRFEPIGPALLSVVQPLRVLGLIPPLAAVLVVVALEVSAPLLRAAVATWRPRFEPWAPWVGFALGAVLVAGALPARVVYTAGVGAELERRRGGHCAGAPRGYDAGEIRRWLGPLRGGRLWFDEHSGEALQKCLLNDGVTLASGVPLGTTVGVGVHVGMLWLAFLRLEPERSGSERRAEALGVRYALGRPIGLPGWQTLEHRGDIELAAHRGPTDLVGAGCITGSWRGNDAAQRSHLIRVLRTAEGADRVLDPNRLVELRHGETSEVVEARVGEGACRFEQTSVRSLPREPGALEAIVESSAPVDVVFRVAAFPTWKISVDGAPAPRTTVVAPGFPSARIPAGRHRVVAVAGSLPGYATFIALGALVVVGLSLLRAEHVGRIRSLLGRRVGPG
jgi:hypothetical protein